MSPPECACDAEQTTEDAFLGGSLSVRQPRRGYRAGIDAVLLAATVLAKGQRAPRVLDLGAGVGTVGLAVARRIADARVVLLEREPSLCRLARGNVERNDLVTRVDIVEADVTASAQALAGHGVGAEGFDVALANPPYHDAARGTPSGNLMRARAHAMAEGELEAWLRVMARVVRPGGRATLVHKSEALGELLAALDGRFGGIKVLPIHPRADEGAHRVLVTGIKGSRAPLVLLPGLVLHAQGSNALMPAAEAIVRHGEGLDLDATMC